MSAGATPDEAEAPAAEEEPEDDSGFFEGLIKGG
jgi:hypothetical protein